jgi:peptidyl-prolyl cis-trans isomerase C
MKSRMLVLACTALLLVAGMVFAAQEDSITFKKYPISEEFRSVVESNTQEDPILGKAGDYVIKKSDVDRMLAYYPPETQQRLQENPAEKKTLVRRMLQIKIVADVAKKEKFDQRPQIKKQLANVADDFLSREYLAKVVMQEATVSEADLKEYYIQNKQSLGVPEQVRARHILFKVDPAASQAEKNKAQGRAQAVLKRVQAGEDFAKLAATHSDDAGSKAKGGDLGYFTPGRMVPDFEDVAFYTNPGETSDIVETKYGYHIIKVEDHIDARERSFEEMKDYIREKLHRQLVMFKVQKFIRQATENAEMQIYSDQILGRKDKKYGKSVMFQIAQHFGRMGAMVKEKIPYNQEVFARNAMVVETLSRRLWEAFMAPGTDRGDTKLNSAAFVEQAKFKEVSQNFKTQTAKLVSAAQSGDFIGIKTQFGEVGKSCKACHSQLHTK